LGRPCGPGAHSRAIRENQDAASPPFPHFAEIVLALGVADAAVRIRAAP
jgi:hypothetical protein